MSTVPVPTYNPPPSGLAPSPLQQLSAPLGGIAPAQFLDVLSADGTVYYWASRAWLTAQYIFSGTAPAWASRLGSPGGTYAGNYLPWLVNAGPFRFTRSLQADAGSFTLQNLSGTSITRDMSSIIVASVFEGALFAYREYSLAAGAPTLDFRGRLTISKVSQSEATFTAENMWNANNFAAPYDVYSENCRWYFGDPCCGQNPAGSPCSRTFATCKWAHQQRYGGVLNTFQPQPGDSTSTVSVRAIVRNRQI
jgi:hypothetical protein